MLESKASGLFFVLKKSSHLTGEFCGDGVNLKVSGSVLLHVSLEIALAQLWVTCSLAWWFALSAGQINHRVWGCSSEHCFFAIFHQG